MFYRFSRPTHLSFTVSSDAVVLMAEMLKVFVQGEAFWFLLLCADCLMMRLFICCTLFPEAAVRSQKQAEFEDCQQVDIEHFEKVLPQLVCSLNNLGF